MRTVAEILASGIQSIPDLQESLRLAAKLICTSSATKPIMNPSWRRRGATCGV